MKILLIQLKRIGDLILTTPVITGFRQKFPDAAVTLAIAQESAGLTAALPPVERLLTMRRGFSDIGNYWSVLRQRFDCAIDFTQNDRSGALTLLSRAGKRIAPERSARHRIRGRAYNSFVNNSVRNMHTIDYNFSLLEPIGITGPAPPLHLELPQAAVASADNLLADSKLQAPVIVFHPASARTEKFWEPERWAAAIEHARASYKADVALTGGASSFEQEHIRRIQNALPRPIVDLSGMTNLPTLMGLISRARLLVTVDSAPMHLAAALRIPQVALFGPTNPFHWRPLQSPAVVLQGDSPEPVRQFSPDTPRLPMKLISTEAVINGMDALLSTPAAGPQ